MGNPNGWADLAKEVDLLQSGEEQPKLGTGFQQLDKLLLGGLSPGLVVLGGNPGAGKSTFCLQLAENVAEGGTQVLYFSFEMPARWLVAKSINRRMFQKGCPVNAAGLMGGSGENRLDEAQWEQVEQVKRCGEFQSALKNLHIWTALPLSASEIRKEALRFAKEHGCSGTGAPLVIIDYLQIVPPERNVGFKNDKEKNDEKVRQFTQLAHEDRFTVILISSLNRGSYTGPMSGAIRLGSFKETGEIEYSADLLLGLQFQNKRKNMNFAREQERNPREVELSVLKNRYGGSGCLVPFEYYAANDFFQEQTAKAPETAGLEVPAPKTKKAKASEAGGRTIWRCAINNTKVANEIQKGRFKQQACVVSRKGDPEIRVKYELSGELSGLDCCVADAIYTVSIRLWGNGIPEKDEPLSPLELMKAVSGAPRPTVTRQKRRELFESIKRLQKVQFSLDCEEELRDRKLEGIGPEKLRNYQGPFLNLEIREGKGGAWDGAEICFKKDVCPLFLHAYGAAVNQMITIPSVLLNVSNGKRMMSNTAENICLKRLLAQRMEVIRRGAGSDTEYMRTISFREKGKLLSELRLEEFWTGKRKLTEEARAQKLRRLHGSVGQILEYYKQIQYISDCERDEKKEGTLQSFKVIGAIRDPMKLS